MIKHVKKLSAIVWYFRMYTLNFIEKAETIYAIGRKLMKITHLRIVIKRTTKYLWVQIVNFNYLRFSFSKLKHQLKDWKQ